MRRIALVYFNRMPIVSLGGKKRKEKKRMTAKRKG